MKNKIIAFILSALSAAGLCSSCKASDIPSVEPVEFKKEIQNDSTAYVLDVRTQEEYAAGHLPSAHNLNVMDEKEFDAGIAELDNGRRYFVYCRSGRRSLKACEIMKQHGFDVTDLKGGIIAWEKASLPIVR